MTGDYAAFISYRHRPLDTAVAARLHRLIEHYRVPKELRHGGQKTVGRVFRDRDELPLSSDLTTELREALDHAAFLIVICSPDTPQSIWVDREIEYFLRSHDRDHVLAVLAAGTQDISFPKRLTEIYAADGVTVVEQVEPLAANIADETNPFTPLEHLLPHRLRVLRRLRGEFLRLMAALLHCPYDTLRQRARQYRQRRALAAAGTVAVVAAAFAVMLLDRNREISRQMRLAQQNEQRALASEAQAQRNESRALALLSEQQLASGDRFTAIQTALDGLPAAGEDRSTHAAAEQALADALYLYRTDAMRTGGILRAEFDIEAAWLSDDGSRLILLDYSAETLHCYDTASSRLLWSQPRGHLLTRYAFTAFVPWQDGQEAFLYAFTNEVELLDMDTGQVLADWKVSKPVDGFDTVHSWAILPDGHTLAAVYHPLPGAEGLLAVTWDLWSGTHLDTLALPYGGPLDIMRETFLFSGDGTRWALLVEDRDTPGESGWQAVYAGLLNGLTLTWRQEYPNLTYFNSLCGLFCGRRDLVLLHVDGRSAGDPVWVERLDVDDGTRAYDAAGTLPWDIDATQTPLLTVLDTVNALLLLDTGICHIDLLNGSLTPQATLESAALCAYPDGDGGLFTALANGVVAQVPKLSVGRYGCEILFRTAPALRAAAAAGAAPTLCLLPESDVRTAWLYRVLGDDEYRLLPMPAPDKTALAAGVCLYPLGADGQLAAIETSRDGDSLYLYDATLQTAQAFTYQHFTLPYDVRPFGLTGDGLLLCTTKTDTVGLWLDTADGQLYTLTGLLPQVDQVARGMVTPDGGETPWFAWLAFLESSDEAGPAFKLRFALDPRQALDAQPPQGVQLDGGPLAIGGNGWAVTTGLTIGDGGTCWAAFDTAAAQWQILPVADAAYNTSLCVGDTRPCFAVLERGGTCRLFDLTDGSSRTLARLPGVDVPARTLLRFADADRVLLAFLPDGTLYVVDTGSGAVRLTVDLPALPAPWSPLLQTDEAGHDLYISDPSGTLPGLCIDLDDACQQGLWEDLLCYLPAGRELAFRNGAYSEGHAPRLFPVLDAAALAARARALLAP